jgi:hypothetical protein
MSAADPIQSATEQAAEVRTPASEIPWRIAAACSLAAAAGMRGALVVDGYHTLFDLAVGTILIVAALLFAWRAVRSPVRWDRLLGYPVFGLMVLIILFMILDRVGRLLTPP